MMALAKHGIWQGYGSSQILQLFSNISSEPELDGIDVFFFQNLQNKEKTQKQHKTSYYNETKRLTYVN
jgi:hypothetical protein